MQYSGLKMRKEVLVWNLVHFPSISLSHLSISIPSPFPLSLCIHSLSRGPLPKFRQKVVGGMWVFPEVRVDHSRQTVSGAFWVKIALPAQVIRYPLYRPCHIPVRYKGLSQKRSGDRVSSRPKEVPIWHTVQLPALVVLLRLMRNKVHYAEYPCKQKQC